MRKIRLSCRCGFAKHYTYLSFLRCCGVNVGWRDTDQIEWGEPKEEPNAAL